MEIFILFFPLLLWCKIYLNHFVLSQFLLLKPNDRLSSFPLETTENTFWPSGRTWIPKRKVSNPDRQQSERGQICLTCESAGLFQMDFIEEFCRAYFSYTRVLLIWRQRSSFTKNKFLNSYFVWHKMKTENEVCLQTLQWPLVVVLKFGDVYKLPGDHGKKQIPKHPPRATESETEG